MQRMFAMLIFVAILSIMSTQAMAETILMSPPLPPGDNGFTCGCLNLTKDYINVQIQLVSSAGVNGLSRNIAYGFVDSYTLNTATTRSCRVMRVDRKTVRTKHLRCTLSAIDINGNPTAVVPVDIKYNIQW